MNANTNTASNGPTMKYHCKVVLAEKTKWHKAKQGFSLLKFYFTQDRLRLKTIPFKTTLAIVHVRCCNLLCYTMAPLFICS